ncbi:DUF2325 domain-containing protein [Metabacillus fastidiosus]|uniref:DUF2325 domain-containing protein n=1 Tax=Metabacillus fastidiosus TaxID=1458 RepID=UPI003D27B3E0
MGSLLVVGADNLGVITNKLLSVGFDEILHISGRKVQMVKKEIPGNISFILVLTDYVNHNLSTVIKQKAKSQSIPVFYAKRSWSSIYQVIKNAV